MTERLKRSSGGYSLRCTGAKKHLSEDFEYYFSKVNADESTTQRKYLGQTQPNCSIKRPRSHSQKVQVLAKPYQDPPDVATIDCDNNQVIYVEDNETPLESKALLCAKQSKETLNSDDNFEVKEDDVARGDDDSQSLSLQPQYIIAEDSEDGDFVIYEGSSVLMGSDRVNESEHQSAVSELSDDANDFLPQLRPGDKIECSACHKLLKPGSFRQHVRTHSGAKPFSCELCESTFTRKGDVDRHVRIVHNKQKPFQCPHCMRAFGDKKNLRWHLANHDKRLFYTCSVCGFKFGKREYYENHVRFLHPTKAVSQDSIVNLNEEDEEEDEKGVESPKSIEELGYLMLVPVENSDTSSCLKLPVEHDGQLSHKLPEVPGSDNVEALVIQLSEGGVDSEIFSSDNLPSGCELIPSEITRIRPESSAEKNSSDVFWENTLGQLSDKWVKEDSSQVIELVMDPHNSQSCLQYVMKSDEYQTRQLINEAFGEDSASMFQLVVDSF